MLMLKSFLLAILVLTSAQSFGWKERKEVRIEGAKFQTVFTLNDQSNLTFNNDYGSIRVVILPQSGNQITISGDYQSNSDLHADIQILTQDDGDIDVFIDGPAEFKSHDYVAGYGKPLDYAFFKRNIGVIPAIRRGEKEGGVVVAGVFATSADTSRMELGPSCSIWGHAVFGGDVMDEGSSLGLLPAHASMVIQVPHNLIKKLRFGCEKSLGTVSVQASDAVDALFDITEQTSNQIELAKKGLSCDDHVAQ